MRFLIGLICGVALTIGVAWFIDHSGSAEHRLVNWDQFEKTVDGARQSVRRLAE